MLDYRHKPEESPVVWCLVCNGLVNAANASKTMSTVFSVTKTGIYPYGKCNLHRPSGHESGLANDANTNYRASTP